MTEQINRTEATKTLLRTFHRGRVEKKSIDRLVARGGDVNAADEEGRTPLHHLLARAKGLDREVACLAWLVEHGADVNRRDGEGRTPLHIEALQVWSRGMAMTRALIAAGADPSVRDRDGRLPEQVVEWPDDLADFFDFLGGELPSRLVDAAELRALRIEQERAALRQAVAEAEPPTAPIARRSRL